MSESNNSSDLLVTSISTNVRRAVQINDSWTTIETGMTATISHTTNVEKAQDRLFCMAATEVNKRIQALQK